MATRIRKKHQDEVRARIKTSQLINRLTDHAIGKIELLPTQVRAIEILIKKTLPDLAAMELTGDEENPIAFRGLERRIVRSGD